MLLLPNQNDLRMKKWMRMKNKIIMLALLGLTALSSSYLEAAPAKAKQAPKLNIISGQQFCHSLTEELKEISIRSTASRKNTMLATSLMSTSIIKSMRAGATTDFLNLQAIIGKDLIPGKDLKRTMIPFSFLIQHTLKLNKPITLAFQPDELRYIPYAQEGMHIVLLADSMGTMNAKRAKSVIYIAKRARITISVIWTGPSSKNNRTAEAMVLLSSLTNGAFIDLGGDEDICGATTH
jgi:hypothetical protein